MHDELIKRLRHFPEDFVAYKMDADFARTVREAADAIEHTSNAYQMMAEAYEAEVTKPRWIPTTERLPEDLQNVLVLDDGQVTIGHCEHYYGDEQIYVEWHDTLYYPIDPPFWMPLPELPKEG